MRICLVYETLYPYFRGGAERWYRSLAERLASEGIEVTYLTLRRWENDERPEIPGVEIVTLGSDRELYTGGRRRVSLTLRFGAAVTAHLARHGSRYDVVHTAALQLTSLAAAAARRRYKFRLVVDWFEVWTRAYWVAYLGPVAGQLAWGAQLLSLRTAHEAVCYSRLHEQRLRACGFRGRITRLQGIYAGPLEPPEPREPDPIVVFLGRHIAEKRVRSVVPAVALAGERIPDLGARIFGDGPERSAVLAQIEQSGLSPTGMDVQSGSAELFGREAGAGAGTGHGGGPSHRAGHGAVPGLRPGIGDQPTPSSTPRSLSNDVALDVRM